MTRREDANAAYDARRWRALPWRAWYSTKAWRLRRKVQLAKVPWCEPCKAMGMSRPATVANHNPPHNGDRRRFFHGPLESTCKPCHDAMIQKAEGLGFRPDLDQDGWPADPSHPFNRTRPA